MGCRTCWDEHCHVELRNPRLCKKQVTNAAAYSHHDKAEQARGLSRDDVLREPLRLQQAPGGSDSRYDSNQPLKHTGELKVDRAHQQPEIPHCQ